MDYETRKEIARLEKRIRELEAKLAISSMPDEASALLDDLQMVPDTEPDETVTLEMIDEFIRDLGYQTRIYPEFGTIIFTDMFKDYELNLKDDGHISMILCEDLCPEVDRNMVYLIISTQDLSADVKMDPDKYTLEFSIQSIELKPQTYRDTIRFFIGSLNESEREFESIYMHAREVKWNRFGNAVYS
jgi:hypothetical protein